MKKKNSEVQQRMDNHLVANRFHEITNEIQTLQVYSLCQTKEFLRNFFIGFCWKFDIKLIIRSFIIIRFHSYVTDYHSSILANFETRLYNKKLFYIIYGKISVIKSTPRH